MKFVCFVLFVLMRSTKPGCFRLCSWCLWKALEEEGCMGWVPWRLDLQCKSSRILNWMVSSLRIKSNCNWKFWRNWNVSLVSLERSWWARFIGIYLVRVGLRMWEILILKWFQKPGFGRENQLRTWWHLGQGTGRTSSR
jgi:hypothetical protein